MGPAIPSYSSRGHPCPLSAHSLQWVPLTIYEVPLPPIVAQLGKNLPAVQETRVQLLGREDPLEKEMATRSSILAWKISWTEEPVGLQSMGLQESDTT